MTVYANVGHILLKRGNTVQSTAYTGPLGELTYDTDLGTVRVHNNVTPGGVNILATQAQVNLINANLASAVSTIGNSIGTITGIDAIFVANINTLLANAAVQSLAIGNLQAFQTYANATFSTSSYGNTTVESYLGANVGSLWSNAATQATSLNTITANLGAYQTWANANAATQAGTITTLQTQVYTNANVASYLPTYTGGISSGNISTTGSVNIGSFLQLPVYADGSARDAAIPNPRPGMMVYVTSPSNRVQIYTNGWYMLSLG
jgi:hypothetical protein